MGKFTGYSLPLKTLAKGEHDFSFHLDKQFFVNMESQDVRDANLEAKVKVIYNGDVYDLSFSITGTVTVQCDRCLEEMPWPIEASYHIQVKYGDAYRDDSDELLEIPDTVNDLNVAYMIYDTVSLAIPIKHVHPMGKCNRQMTAMLRKHRVHNPDDEDAGLEDELMDEIDADADGADDSTATDPRWNALRDIAADSDSDGDE